MKVEVEYTDGSKAYAEVPSPEEAQAYEKKMRNLLTDMLPMLGIDPETGMEFEK